MDNTRIPFEAYRGTGPYIFVSYAHKDSGQVFPIIAEFHQAGFPVWYDEGIDPGNEWPEEIAKALLNCSLFIVFISSSAAESKNVVREINYALTKNKPFIHIWLEDTTLNPGLEMQISSNQGIMRFRMEPENFSRKCQQSFEAFGIKGAKPQVKGEKGGSSSSSVDFDIKNGVLKKYKGKGGNVVIPYGVTAIGMGAFEVCEDLLSVSIPDSVISIGEGAFGNCRKLSSVSIPNSVSSIGKGALWNCKSLARISIPYGVTVIMKETFLGCASLVSVSIPDSVTSIGGGAFSNCFNLARLSLPNGLTFIGKSAFYNCASLTSVSIPNSVTTIEDFAFMQCTNLISVSIPDRFNSIRDKIFHPGFNR
jgi:hypothetical protein